MQIIKYLTLHEKFLPKLFSQAQENENFQKRLSGKITKMKFDIFKL